MDPLTDPSRRATGFQTAAFPWLAVLGGAAATLLMAGLYLGLITLAESWPHAVEQLRADALWVGLVAAGFGVQMGLFLAVRRAVRSLGATNAAVTGVGAGASVSGMVACCAHHLVDLAPFIGLTGATVFLSRYRLAFILFGLALNLVGIALSLRTLSHLARTRRPGGPKTHKPAPTCH